MVFTEAVLPDHLGVYDETPDEKLVFDFGFFDFVGLDHVHWSVFLVSAAQIEQAHLEDFDELRVDPEIFEIVSHCDVLSHVLVFRK